MVAEYQSGCCGRERERERERGLAEQLYALLLLPLRPELRLARSVSRGQDTGGITSGLCHATSRDIVTGISRDSVTQSPGGRHVTTGQCLGCDICDEGIIVNTSISSDQI